jgi:hypothetical protein
MINFKNYNTRQLNSESLGLKYYTEQEIKTLLRISNSYAVFGGFGLGITLDGRLWLINDSRDSLAFRYTLLRKLKLETGELYKRELWFTSPQEASSFTNRFEGRIITWEEYNKRKIEGLVLLYSEYSYDLVKTQEP